MSLTDQLVEIDADKLQQLVGRAVTEAASRADPRAAEAIFAADEAKHYQPTNRCRKTKSKERMAMRFIRVKYLTGFAIIASLVGAAGAHAAVIGLPAGVQVNNDLPAIDPGQDAGSTDLTAGSLTAGGARVPWATFSQKSGASQQIFVRAFKGGVWHTQGFPESLNEDGAQVAQAPAIDFTGPGRTVPWVGWAEPSAVLGHAQIFASRFLAQPAPAQGGGQWIHEGQQVAGTAPSLNINTNRDAAAPSLIGATTIAGANPAPWLTWQEFDGQQGACDTAACAPQIFVSHAVPAAAGACPAATKPNHGSSVGNFCFQQVGIDRVPGPSAGQLDPSLNIDPSRSGIEGDIAFTGPNDTIPWTVWYENSDSNGGHLSSHGLFNADMVFAARAIPDGTGDGGFHWQTVGLGTAGKTAANDILDTSGAQRDRRVRAEHQQRAGVLTGRGLGDRSECRHRSREPVGDGRDTGRREGDNTVDRLG